MTSNLAVRLFPLSWISLSVNTGEYRTGAHSLSGYLGVCDKLSIVDGVSLRLYGWELGFSAKHINTHMHHRY